MFQKKVKSDEDSAEQVQIEVAFLEAMPTLGRLLNGEHAGYEVTRWQIAERDDGSWLSVMNIVVREDAGAGILPVGEREGYYVFFAGAATMIGAIAKAERLVAEGEARLVADVMAAQYVKNKPGVPRMPKKPRKVTRE